MVGGAAFFDGSILASQGNIIVAIINYRLGILGFLNGNTPLYPGNNGLRDQLLAIKWLKQNCLVLNCNPNSITVWGHSAGAADVTWLASSQYSHLFQRIISQSGNAFSYWSFDKTPNDRLESLRHFYKCDSLIQTMESLIQNCLLKIKLEKLLKLKFAFLLDMIGPSNDGFLHKDSIINADSARDLINKQNNIKNIDILTGINSMEGYIFQFIFSQSVKYWTQNNLKHQMILTLERFSLLFRDKCKQNSLIEHRLSLEEFYNNKLLRIIKSEEHLQYEDVQQFKQILLTSDLIFDAGFVEFLNLITNKSKLFVYEYLHENSANLFNLNWFKKYFNSNFDLTTHFDSIDLAFGLPIAEQLNSATNHTDIPFKNFQMENYYNEHDVNMSRTLMSYFSNFIKYG